MVRLEPIEMRKRDGAAHAIRWRGRYYPIRAVLNSWRMEDGWWRMGLARHYYKVELEGGLLALLFQDLPGGDWYLEKLYD